MVKQTLKFLHDLNVDNLLFSYVGIGLVSPEREEQI